MRNGSSIEAWLFMLITVISIVVVFVVGIVAMKLYRKLRPFEEQGNNGFSISIAHNLQTDGFFKIFFVGLLLTSPILYILYSNI